MAISLAPSTSQARSAGTTPSRSGDRLHFHGLLEALSPAARLWWLREEGLLTEGDPKGSATASSTPSFGTNVDANDPSLDYLGGQTGPAIAAAGLRMMVGWHDISGVPIRDSTRLDASITGVSYSDDGGRSFVDLIGLPNPNPNQQWFGLPTIVAMDGGEHFIVADLYWPSSTRDCNARPRPSYALAMTVATVTAGGVSFGDPIIATDGGNACNFVPGLSFLDKPWLDFDPKTRTLAMSYTRFLAQTGKRDTSSGCNAGQIEVVRARVPADPNDLRSGNFSDPVVVWPEECNPDGTVVINQGSNVAVDGRGNAYVAWERNAISNVFFSNDPYVYVHAALVRWGAGHPATGGPDEPVVLTKGQVNSTPAGGIRSLDGAAIAGSGHLGVDWPRVAVNRRLGEVEFVWPDASLHPLGDVWLRAMPKNLDLSEADPIRRVNDDADGAVHLEPAVSVRSDGVICMSWYDRRLWGADSPLTDYFGECRPGAETQMPDFRITTGETDWANTSRFFDSDFGVYTDNDSTGRRTYFAWTDGRIGVPQPFVDSSFAIARRSTEEE